MLHIQRNLEKRIIRHQHLKAMLDVKHVGTKAKNNAAEHEHM